MVSMNVKKQQQQKTNHNMSRVMSCKCPENTAVQFDLKLGGYAGYFTVDNTWC